MSTLPSPALFPTSTNTANLCEAVNYFCFISFISLFLMVHEYCFSETICVLQSSLQSSAHSNQLCSFSFLFMSMKNRGSMSCGLWSVCPRVLLRFFLFCSVLCVISFCNILLEIPDVHQKWLCCQSPCKTSDLGEQQLNKFDGLSKHLMRIKGAEEQRLYGALKVLHFPSGTRLHCLTWYKRAEASCLLAFEHSELQQLILIPDTVCMYSPVSFQVPQTWISQARRAVP